MRSLKNQLTVSLVLTLVGAFGMQAVLMYFAIYYVAERHVASRLQHDIESLLANLDIPPGGSVFLDLQHIHHIYHQPLSGHYYRITLLHQTLRSRSLWDEDLDIPVLMPGEHREFKLLGPQRQHLLVIAEGFRKQNTVLTISVAEELEGIAADIVNVQMGYFGLSLVLLLLLVLVQRYAIVRNLQPLLGVRFNLQGLIAGDTERLEENVPTEIKPLVIEINHLLELLTRRLTQSRVAIGNLAHALKTPLAVLMQLAEQASVKVDGEARKTLLAQTTIIHRQIQRELKRACLAGPGRGSTRFKPAEDFPALIRMFEQIYQDKDLKIHLDLTEISNQIDTDREDMLELAGNVIDNACKWAKGHVQVHCEAASKFRLLIEDDGPGCSPEQLSQLGQRGWRLDEQKEGHGLGLAIARDIVKYYQGTIKFDHSAWGGLKVAVELPLLVFTPVD